MTVHTLTDVETNPGAALKTLELELSIVKDDPNYPNSKSSREGQICISGQLPYRNGSLPLTGAVGQDVDTDTVRDMMSQGTLNALSVAAQAAGGVDRVRLVQMTVFVNNSAGFHEHSRVADAVSELLVKVLGEHGRHAPTAVGVAGLPRNSPVEVQMICEVRA